MKNKKAIIIAIVAILIIVGITAGVVINKSKKEENTVQIAVETKTESKEEEGVKEKVDIIDINSKTRPYAVVVNNTPVAVKVQTGLNKAYIVYEIPTEGFTSRLMALYKDIDENVTIGTIRSSRHNFIDYALESDAIYVHFGWSHYAKDDEKAGSINYINGLSDMGFWRDNPENLASEHTAYTSTQKIDEMVKNKKFNTESDKTILLNYNVADVDLSKKEKAQKANKISIPYGSNGTEFTYDSEAKMYNRIVNGKNNTDHKTKEQLTAKNIIVQKVDYNVCDDGYYWDLKTIGTGTGYFITNGYAVPIKWEKKDRTSKTKYMYEDGQEIEVSDGRTYIEIQTTSKDTTIE